MSVTLAQTPADLQAVHAADVFALLGAIAGEITFRTDYTPAEYITWAHAGDMVEVSARLRELAQFLGVQARA